VCNIRGVRAARDRRYAAETEELDHATEHTEGKKKTRPSETRRRARRYGGQGYSVSCGYTARWKKKEREGGRKLEVKNRGRAGKKRRCRVCIPAHLRLFAETGFSSN